MLLRESPNVAESPDVRSGKDVEPDVRLNGSESPPDFSANGIAIELSPWHDEVRNDKDLSPNGTNKLSACESDYKSEDMEKVPSNEFLLAMAFFSFMGFALLEIVAAVVAGSEALMGDSAAMIVDSLTYLFNLLAERKKKRFASDHVLPPAVLVNPERAKRIFRRDLRKMTLQLELVTPLVSASGLVIVTGVVLHQAVKVIILDTHRKRSEQSDPNLTLMLGFSVFNLVLDLLNVCYFAKAKHLFGFETVEHDNSHQSSQQHGSKPLLLHNGLFLSDRDITINNVYYSPVDNNDDGGFEQLELVDGLLQSQRQYQPTYNGDEAAPSSFQLKQSNWCAKDRLVDQIINGDNPENQLSQKGIRAYSPSVESWRLDDESKQAVINCHSSSTLPLDTANDADFDFDHDNTNLNMCSAYTASSRQSQL